MDISIILPVHNERENLRLLLEEIDRAMQPVDRPFEVLAIDDGSTDGSLQLLQSVCGEKPYLKIVRFRQNYGQSAAFDAGFRFASGQIVVTMDADGQNDPADIPRMIEMLEKQGFDFVAGRRRHRKDNQLFRKLPSKIANFLIRIVTQTQFRDLGCSLKVYRRQVTQELRLYGEMHRFISVLVEGMGARVAQTSVNHRPRVAGRSKYGLARTFKVLLDLLTVWFIQGYQTKPIYVFGSIGMLLGFSSVIMSTFVLYQKFIHHIFVHLQPLFVVAMMFAVMSVQFLGMGLIAEIMIRTYFESQQKTAYLIGGMTGFDRDRSSIGPLYINATTKPLGTPAAQFMPL